MKTAKRIFVWVTISLIFQLSVLFYMDQFFLKGSRDYSVSKINTNIDSSARFNSVAIPGNAKDIKVSFDGKFTAYMQNGRLKVISSIKGSSTKNVETDSDKIIYYKWIGDRNRMIAAEKETQSGASTFKLIDYDADKNKIGTLKDIKVWDKNAEVTGMDFSTDSQIKYIKITQKNGRSMLYWINIMEEMKKIPVVTSSISDIKALSLEDKLLYEDGINHKIHCSNYNKYIRFSGNSKLCLLGTDEDDNVYIGGMNSSNKVCEIYSGTLDKPFSGWKSTQLKQTALKKDIYISNTGNVYVNDETSKTLLNIENKSSISYSGQFVGIFEGGAAYLQNGKLSKKALK